jgi:hypothetical protein
MFGKMNGKVHMIIGGNMRTKMRGTLHIHKCVVYIAKQLCSYSTASITECCYNGSFRNLTQLFVNNCPNMDSRDILGMMILCSSNLVNIEWYGVLYNSFDWSTI